MKLSKKFNTVLRSIRAFCKAEGIKLVLDHKNEYLDGDMISESSAYFSHSPVPLIKVSTVNREPAAWIANLLHEVAHAEQWLEDAEVWQNCSIDGIDAETLAQMWMDKRFELTIPQRNRIFDALFYVEYDAEVRTTKFLLHYDLAEEVDLDNYIRGAWAYIYSYKVAAICRKWIPANKPPYKIEEILANQAIIWNDELLKLPASDWLPPFAASYPELFVHMPWLLDRPTVELASDLYESESVDFDLEDDDGLIEEDTPDVAVS